MRLNDKLIVRHYFFNCVTLRAYAKMKNVHPLFVMDAITKGDIEIIFVGTRMTILIDLAYYGHYQFPAWQTGWKGRLYLLLPNRRKQLMNDREIVIKPTIE